MAVQDSTAEDDLDLDIHTMTDTDEAYKLGKVRAVHRLCKCTHVWYPYMPSRMTFLLGSMSAAKSASKAKLR